MTIKRRLAQFHARLADLWHLPLRRRELDPYHKVMTAFIERVAAMDAPTVLEVGARDVTGVVRRGLFPNAGRYIGLDVHPGPNVDLVGDVHALSQIVEPGSLDAVFSVSVFEHLVYPWKAILEINRVLKPGGLVFIATHPAWPAHELPWDFWRFPVGGLAHLLVPATGFELQVAAEGLPARIYSLVDDPPTRGLREAHINLGVAVIGAKTHDYDPDRLRWDVDLAATVRSEYPPPS